MTTEQKKHFRWLFTLEEPYEYRLTVPYSKKLEEHFKKFLPYKTIEFRDKKKNKPRLWISLEGQTCSNELKIAIKVCEKYSWDGASPKISIFDLFWVGTPDGIEILHSPEGADIDRKPATYYASLVHDVLGQFKRSDDMPFNKLARDLIFFKMLDEVDFKLSIVYFLGVAILGPFYDLYVTAFKSNEEGKEGFLSFVTSPFRSMASAISHLISKVKEWMFTCLLRKAVGATDEKKN